MASQGDKLSRIVLPDCHVFRWHIAIIPRTALEALAGRQRPGRPVAYRQHRRPRGNRTFSLDGRAGWNPLSWFQSLRPTHGPLLRPNCRRPRAREQAIAETDRHDRARRPRPPPPSPAGATLEPSAIVGWPSSAGGAGDYIIQRCGGFGAMVFAAMLDAGPAARARPFARTELHSSWHSPPSASWPASVICRLANLARSGGLPADHHSQGARFVTWPTDRLSIDQLRSRRRGLVATGAGTATPPSAAFRALSTLS